MKNPTTKAMMLAINKGTEIFRFTPQRIANGDVTTSAIIPHTVALGYVFNSFSMILAVKKIPKQYANAKRNQNPA